MKISSFKDLIVWQKGHMLVLEIYSITKEFTKEELFGLTNQIRRAAVSFTSNIAEGFSRSSYKEKTQFYSISLGSLTEIETQLIIAKDLEYISNKKYDKLIERIIELHKITNGIIKKSKTLIHNSRFLIL